MVFNLFIIVVIFVLFFNSEKYFKGEKHFPSEYDIQSSAGMRAHPHESVECYLTPDPSVPHP